MSRSSDNIVIDLTDSFTLASHSGLSNMVIDLATEDSIIEVNSSLENHSVTGNLFDSNGMSNRPQAITKNRSGENRNSIKKENIKQEHLNNNETNSDIIRSIVCPICREELGKVSKVATKCGHVFCIECLKKSLLKSQTCPSCRRVLKGNSAYHPIYL